MVKTLAIGLLAAAPALAGPLETFGFGGVGQARGGAETAAAEDFSAVYYNPAQLVGGHSVNLGIGYNYSVPRLYAENDAGSIPTLKRPPEMGGLHLGFVFPLGGKVEDRVAIGLGVYMPTINVVRTQSIDEKIPQFYMFTSNTDKLGIMFAVAVQILPELSVGAGVNALSSMGGKVDFQVDLFAKRFDQRTLSIDLVSAIAPLAGVTWAPMPDLRVALAFKGQLELEYSLPTLIDLGRDVGALKLDISGVAHWTPHTLTLGGWYRLDPSFAVNAELGWQQWSAAPKDQVQVKLDLSGAVIDGLGLGKALDMDTSADPGMRFSNIFVPRVGVEWKPNDWAAVRAGYFYRPSPVPDQTSRTNYLDNNTHGFSLGCGVGVHDPLEVFAGPVHFDAWLQVNALAQRAAFKDKNLRDPLGDYRFGGAVWQFGLGARYTLK